MLPRECGVPVVTECGVPVVTGGTSSKRPAKLLTARRQEAVGLPFPAPSPLGPALPFLP